MKNDSLLFYRIVRDFLTIYLPKQRGASQNTAKSYRDTLNLFIDYISASQGTPLADISFKCISREPVESFLMWLKTDRGYSVNSRNQRMCAVKSFLRYAAEKDKILMPLFLDVKVIPKKKDTRVREIEFFSESALKAILAQPDRNKKNGQRDLFFMILMYDTGARAQETSTDVPEHLYPHMWRHSRAMHLYRNGMPLPLVAEWLGHAKMDTTMCFMQMLIQR